jgi:hypothetical protein
LQKARKARRLERVFAMQIPTELYEKLESELTNDE